MENLTPTEINAIQVALDNLHEQLTDGDGEAWKVSATKSAIKKFKAHDKSITKVVGNVPVDSGQIFIADPCNLGSFEDNDFISERGITHRIKAKTYYYPQDFTNYGEPLEEEDGKTPNELLEEGWEDFTIYKNVGEYSYEGVCGLTIKKGCGMTNNQWAFTTSTQYGDGGYDVVGHFKSAKAKSPYKITINL